MKGRKHQGGVQMGHQEQNNVIAHGNSLQLLRRMADQDIVVYCNFCKIIQDFSAYSVKLYRCSGCLQTQHLVLLPTSRNFLYTHNFLRSCGVETSINYQSNESDIDDNEDRY